MDAAATAREEASSRWRLVLTAAPRAKPHAYLYDGDAGPYATPRWEFDLEPYQEIPPIEPGACVDAEGQMRRGARPVLRAGNVTIRPGKGLRESRSDRMLVARGDVVAHPRVAGPNPSWRYVSSHSLDTVEQWQHYVDHRVKAAVRETVFYAAFALAYLGVGLYLLLTGRTVRGGYFGGDFETISLVVWLLLALRARHVLREARALRNAPAADMWMRLWWSVGEGEGPIAVASLSNARDGEEIARVPVVGVTPETPTESVVPVRVHGLASGSPMIEVDGRALWPAQHARFHTERGWEPRR